MREGTGIGRKDEYEGQPENDRETRDRENEVDDRDDRFQGLIWLRGPQSALRLFLSLFLQLRL